ncbi:NAD(P)H-dependent oxidoreductase [Aureibacter tunicatorum]|uniref:Nitroreductase n=1 Tax=Aureibacter tunicatorum TaxID=866807 RepID=A0AAE4BST3_9BACT|nr:NAD(P)H-dependent oxidoreductase [Aureibacter tunicatorum]MDR6240101.1 nitroreductase [Aureibacter tunicatorum]BDD04572.1 NAD(P)H-dependent oxidoreductase [Aureibacter tunicatorum]
MSLMESLKWRSAVRNFDLAKKVSKNDLESLLEAGNLTATSMGLQPFKIVVVDNEELQKQMVSLSYNQQQVADASHILIFAIDTNVNQENIDAYIDRVVEVRGVKEEDLEGYKNSVSNYLSMMDQDTKLQWATKQAYIALGTVMTVASELKIDSCAMEGFDSLQYQELLNLGSKELMPVVILPIGYRSDKEQMASLPKVRKTRDNFVIEINESEPVEFK